MNIMKRYFLGIAEMPMLGPLMILTVGFPITVLISLLLGLSLEVLGIGALITSLAALFSIPVYGWARKNRVSLVSDFVPYSARKRGSGKFFLLSKKYDKVYMAGSFWGKEDVHLIELPFMVNGQFSIDVEISQPVGREDKRLALPKHVAVEVALTVETDGDFSPSELYQHVILNKFDSVELWLRNFFKRSAEHTLTVVQAFQERGNHHPTELAHAVEEVIGQVKFDQPFTNIVRIRAKVFPVPESYEAIAVFTR